MYSIALRLPNLLPVDTVKEQTIVVAFSIVTLTQPTSGIVSQRALVSGKKSEVKNMLHQIAGDMEY